MKNKPLISVIMPVYNSGEKILTAIESIVKQGYQNWELIVINDGSTDNTIECINTKICDERIVLINRLENKGIAYSRNEGINKASGMYIAFLDSDDQWLENKLQCQLEKMINVGADFSCSSYYVKKNKHNYLLRKKEQFYTYTDLLKTNFIGCLTVMGKTELFQNNLMPIVNHEDYATWLNILKKDNQIYYVDVPLAIYYKNSNSISSNKIKSTLWALKIIRVQGIDNNKIKNLFYQIRYIFYTLIKGVKKSNE
ncbi:MAG: glycosyltransferase family 2 protein [Vagococcus sp.]|nr:glycosyltransferase family 2 protein [Vagococcus sp.]